MRKFEAIPVVFANGEDDDTLGLVATLSNQRVIYEEDTYEVGQDVRIEGRRLLISRPLLVVGHGQSPTVDLAEFGHPDGPIVVEQPASPRCVTIANCTMILGWVRR